MENTKYIILSRKKKGGRYQFVGDTNENVLPLSFTNLSFGTFMENNWKYYTGVFDGASVTVCQSGDIHDLYTMGCFGKGVLSRSRPNHADTCQVIPPPSRKLPPLRVMNRNKYIKHLNWHRQTSHITGEFVEIQDCDIADYMEAAQKSDKLTEGEHLLMDIDRLPLSESSFENVHNSGHALRISEEVDVWSSSAVSLNVGLVDETKSNAIRDSEENPKKHPRIECERMCVNTDPCIMNDSSRSRNEGGSIGGEMNEQQEATETVPAVSKNADDRSTVHAGVTDDWTMGIDSPRNQNNSSCSNAMISVNSGGWMQADSTDRHDVDLVDGVACSLEGHVESFLVQTHETMRDPLCLNAEADGDVLVVPDTHPPVGESMHRGGKRAWSPVVKRDPFPIHEHLVLSLEEAFFLSYGLGCLTVTNNANTLMSVSEIWHEFCKARVSFLPCYVAYHHFRSKGWVPKCGLKFGAHFLLYKTGPEYHHASFAVLVQPVNQANLCPPHSGIPLSWISLQGLNRVSETVAKEVLICYVIMPELDEVSLKSPECIKRISVQEVAVKRWISSQEREGSL